MVKEKDQCWGRQQNQGKRCGEKESLGYLQKQEKWGERLIRACKKAKVYGSPEQGRSSPSDAVRRAKRRIRES